MLSGFAVGAALPMQLSIAELAWDFRWAPVLGECHAHIMHAGYGCSQDGSGCRESGAASSPTLLTCPRFTLFMGVAAHTMAASVLVEGAEFTCVLSICARNGIHEFGTKLVIVNVGNAKSAVG